MALTLVFQAVIVGVVLYSFALLVLPLSEAFAVPRSRVVLVLTLTTILGGLLSPLAGKAIDHFPVKWVLIVGIMSAAIGLSLVSISAYYWQLLAAYCTFLTFGMILAGTMMAQSLITRWFVARRGLALGISALGTAIGGLLFPLLLGILIPSIGWRHTVLITAAMALALAPLSWLILNREAGEEDLAREQKPEDKISDVAKAYKWEIQSLARSSHFWIIVGCIAPLPFVAVGVQVNLAAFAQDLGFSPAESGMLLSLLFSGMLAGKMLCGILTDRWKLHWIMWSISALFVVALVGFVSVYGYGLLLVVAFLFGFANGGILPLMGAVVGNLYGAASFGTVMGFGSVFFMATTSLGPLAVSMLQETAGSYPRAFAALIVVLLPSVVLTFFLPQKPIEPTPTS